MKTAKRTITGCLLAAIFMIFPALHVAADNASFEVPLNAPKFESLHASIQVGENPVDISFDIEYDASGKPVFKLSSSVDGQPVTGKITQSGTSDVFKFSFSAKNSGTPKIGATVSGTGGESDPLTAKCTYSGPKGKVTVLANPVELVRTTPTAHIALDFQIDSKGKISGTGAITGAYGIAADPGTLKGTLKNGNVKWTLKQGKQQLSFSGTVGETSWNGILKVSIPPAKMTTPDFTIPVSALPPGSTATFSGTLSIASMAGTSPAEGVAVTFRSDLNNDGAISSQETASAQTDSDGKFGQSFSVVQGNPVIIDFRLPGYVAATRVLSSVTPGSNVIVNATLQQLKELKVSENKARSEDGKLIIENLPQGVGSIKGQTFNPVTETNQFPGAFADETGALLVSSVFSVIQAEDLSGNELKALDTTSTLKMQVPEDTWTTLRDLAPGNDKIEVPLYYFDEATGQWKRDANNGWLVDANGITIPESSLNSIRAKTYTGSIYAAGEITHFSYWNIDWPVETHGCVKGKVVDSTGTPVQGATVSIKGVTYTGSASPQVTADDGVFCADVMRSESPSEDIDGNGISGEVHQVEVVVSQGGQYYKFGPYPIPQTQGSCGSGDCLDLGNLSLTEDTKLTVTLCDVNGKVVFSGTSAWGSASLNPGDPIEGAMVVGSDSDAADSLWTCVLEGICTMFDTTDPDGNFTLKVPVLTAINLFAVKYGNPDDPHAFDYYVGQQSTQGCPAQPVTIRADYYGAWQLFATISGDGDGYLTVWDGGASCYFTSNGDYLWGSVSNVSPPLGTGLWFTMDLEKVTETGATPAGQISFTLTNIGADQRYSGTWSMTGLSGVWAE